MNTNETKKTRTQEDITLPKMVKESEKIINGIKIKTYK